MKFGIAFTSLLIGAGAGVALARPSPLEARHPKKHHKTSKYSSSSNNATNPYPTASGTYPTASGSGTRASGAPISTGTGSSSGGSSGTGGSGSGGNATGQVAPGSYTASSGCTFKDADAFKSGKSGCKSIVLSSITVPAGVTLDGTGLADGTTVTFEGTTTFEYEEWEGPLVSFSGNGITIQGAEGHLINMQGNLWWDGEGSNGGKTKPKGFYAHDLIDSTIVGLSIKNTPIQCFSVNSAQNIVIKGISIDNTEGDTEKGGHNTDAFDVGSSTGVYISGVTVHNQDDCLAVNSGTDISFTDSTCSGGHGISIGSVGGRKDNEVKNIHIANNKITKSDNGVRIKTVYGATGSVTNVTYTGIEISEIAKYGVVIEQDYENGSPTGKPTKGVPITQLTLENISGSVTSSAKAVYVLCAACSDWTVTSVSVTGGEKSCQGAPTAGGLC